MQNEFENKLKLMNVVDSIKDVMSSISSQTTTWNYLDSALNDIQSIIETVFKDVE